ncbi:LysR family transcriptional regulator [Caulobacter flavus]|uniref:LysR family transcriptional regulator n=2 Tax=Caulobacter flavus TaxID=1679497 RepID=A0A2N5D267_9CAUL|nr:LysR family transcriptional regulator [Caulobacter flavus]AYV46782.1 LysR family transcriptional regulator [Caulobacter flavus]PLR20076.1 LysR family transcriptional regulator [Caulobacter flavus]
MDRFEAMRLFTRVVERRSFTQAAADLALPRSTATEAVQQLEARLGVRLLQRTTRSVAPTLDGEAYYRRCLKLLDELDETENAFRRASPRGELRVDVQGALARRFLLPGLPAFLATYPELRLRMTEGDRLVDLVAEGVDCVLRLGTPSENNMAARRVALLPEVTCAAPAYVERRGAPASPADLARHRMVGFARPDGGWHPLEVTEGDAVRQVQVPADVVVSSAESSLAMGLLGLGLIQVPRYRADEHLASGALVEVLATHPPTPTPVHLLWPRDRQLSARTRVFIDWAAERLKAAG